MFDRWRLTVYVFETVASLKPSVKPSRRGSKQKRPVVFWFSDERTRNAVCENFVAIDDCRAGGGQPKSEKRATPRFFFSFSAMFLLETRPRAFAHCRARFRSVTRGRAEAGEPA